MKKNAQQLVETVFAKDFDYFTPEDFKHGVPGSQNPNETKCNEEFEVSNTDYEAFLTSISPCL